MSALAAIVRRDLQAASRAGTPAWARAAAVAGTGGAAVVALASLGAAPHDEIGLLFSRCMVGLMALGLAVATSLALGAFRSERAKGTLELLLLSGISPSRLALGRTLSSFLLLESLLAAALPGLALFWFFRSPVPRDLLAHLLAVSCFLAVLAALAVAVSAWTRASGTALLATGLVLGGFTALSLTSASMQTWSAPGLVELVVLSPDADRGERLALCLAFHAVIAALALLATRAGLERGPRASRRSEGPRSTSAPRLSDGRPLTWLLLRTSPAARPGLQLAAIGLPLAGLVVAERLLAGEDTSLLEPQLLSVLGGALGCVVIVLALSTGATAIAGRREGRAWDGIAASSRSSERLLLDLLAASCLSCLVPFLAAAVLLAGAELLRGNSLTQVLATITSFLAACLLAGTLGLAASACTRTTATAIALAAVLLLGIPVMVGSLSSVDGGALAAGVLRSGLGALLVAGLLLPLLVRGVMPFVMALLARWRRRTSNGAPAGPGALVWRAVLILAPLAFLTGLTEVELASAWAVSFGGLGTCFVHLVSLGEAREWLSTQVLLTGTLWQSLFSLLVLSGTWRHRDLWLGRAAR